MESLFDVHTHRIPEIPGLAIENIRFPAPFEPQPGRYYSLGIHPWDVAQFTEEQVDWTLFYKYASHPQVLAIGEAGMDKCIHPELLLRQKFIFTHQLRIADDVQKPIILHNVRSTDTLRLCKEHSNFQLPWVQHGFRNNAPSARRAIAYGFYLSFGPRYNEEALRATPLNRLLLETDDSETDIHEVYRRAAETLSLPITEFTATIQENIQRVFFTRQ